MAKPQPGLKFNPGNHSYRLDGKPVPGVTTIIGKGLPKPALAYWSARTVAEYVADNPDGVDHLRAMGRGPMVAALKGIPWQRRDEAAIRGTEVHTLAEHVVHGEPVEVPEHLAPVVEGYAHFLDAHDVQPILVEARLANRAEWYAGTADLFATLDGEPWLLDLKSGSGIYGNFALQLAAYAKAEFYADDDGERPIPDVAGIAAVHVTDAGSRLHRYPDMEAAWRIFRHVKYIAAHVPTIESWSMTNE